MYFRVRMYLVQLRWAKENSTDFRNWSHPLSSPYHQECYEVLLLWDNSSFFWFEISFSLSTYILLQRFFLTCGLVPGHHGREGTSSQGLPGSLVSLSVLGTDWSFMGWRPVAPALRSASPQTACADSLGLGCKASASHLGTSRQYHIHL